MNTAPNATRSPGTVLIATFLTTVIAFVASTVATAGRLHQVSIQSEDIYGNAMPSVIALSSLRERMHQLNSDLNTAVDARATVVPSFLDRVGAIEAQAKAYVQHAPPDESGAWATAQAQITRVIDDAKRVRDRLATKDPEGARALIDSELRPDLAKAHVETWHLVELNAAMGQQSARHIEKVRESTTILSFFLDALCVALAVVLGVVGFRAMRTYTRLVERRSQELEQFAERVAHDLRGPLSPVLMALQRVRKEGDALGSLQNTVDIAVRSVGRITTLVDDLLGFALAGGRADLSARTSALAVARATVEDVQPVADAQSIAIHVDDQALDVTVACPPGVLSSLLSNLVRNAVKYMGDARVRKVVVRILRSGERARVEVEDTGPGLPPDVQASVFEPYVRADRSGQPGLGLGLATVKRLAEAYGGEAGVRSKGEGCTFWFELSLARDGAASDLLAQGTHTDPKTIARDAGGIGVS